MRGIPALLLNLAFPAVWVGFLTAFAFKYLNWRRPVLVLGAVVLGSFVLIAGNQFAQNVIWYVRLARLDTTAVASIELDGKVIDDESRKARLVAALNSTDWYYCNHCSSAEDHLLVLRYSDGSSRGFFFNVGNDGAILVLRSNLGKGGYLSYGHLSSSQLPIALADCGLLGQGPT